MASSSNSNVTASTTTFVVPNFSQFITYKLDETNYLLWLSQIVPILKGHELMGIVDGSEPCPPQFLSDDEDKEVQNPLLNKFMRQRFWST
jgi:cytochrome c-type biogenesis protein CcmH/NrfF